MATEKRIVVNGISLRRDLVYNSQRVGDKFIPKKGEVCLVETLDAGLRALVGDGVKTYNQLDYVDYIFYRGHFEQGNFWKDENLTEELEKNTNKIYIATNNNNSLYIYNGVNYEVIGQLPYANSKEAGIVKLYEETGYNIDGTMTQKAITEELEKKVEVSVDGETVFFN